MGQRAGPARFAAGDRAGDAGVDEVAGVHAVGGEFVGGVAVSELDDADRRGLLIRPVQVRREQGGPAPAGQAGVVEDEYQGTATGGAAVELAQVVRVQEPAILGRVPHGRRARPGSAGRPRLPGADGAGQAGLDDGGAQGEVAQPGRGVDRLHPDDRPARSVAAAPASAR